MIGILRKRLVLAILLISLPLAAVGTDRQPRQFRASLPADIIEALELADVHESDVVYDLGSGDGRVVIMAAERFGASGVGVEIDPKLVAVSLKAVRENHLEDRVSFVHADFNDVDISRATVVFVYLGHRYLYEQAARHIAHFCRRKTRVIFPKGQEPDRALPFRLLKESTKFALYEITL